MWPRGLRSPPGDGVRHAARGHTDSPAGFEAQARSGTALQQPQYRPTTPLVAEALSEQCMDAVVAALGDAADEPDRQQVLEALEEVQDRFPASTVALMLAYVSVTDMVAADVCDEILASDERFTPKP